MTREEYELKLKVLTDSLFDLESEMKTATGQELDDLMQDGYQIMLDKSELQAEWCRLRIDAGAKDFKQEFEFWKSQSASFQGKIKSEKKARASAENGKKGGRPRTAIS